MKKAPSPFTVKSAFQDQNKHIDSTKQAKRLIRDWQLRAKKEREAGHE